MVFSIPTSIVPVATSQSQSAATLNRTADIQSVQKPQGTNLRYSPYTTPGATQAPGPSEVPKEVNAVSAPTLVSNMGKQYTSELDRYAPPNPLPTAPILQAAAAYTATRRDI